MKTIEKVEIQKLDFPVANVYNYDAMIFRSVDGGKTFAYCGCGKLFATLEEAERYKEEIESNQSKRWSFHRLQEPPHLY